jgi:hypothetical protein
MRYFTSAWDHSSTCILNLFKIKYLLLSQENCKKLAETHPLIVYTMTTTEKKFHRLWKIFFSHHLGCFREEFVKCGWPFYVTLQHLFYSTFITFAFLLHNTPRSTPPLKRFSLEIIIIFFKRKVVSKDTCACYWLFLIIYLIFNHWNK